MTMVLHKGVKIYGLIMYFVYDINNNNNCRPILLPLIFALVMDWILKTALANFGVGLERTKGSRFSDLEYADDAIILDTADDGMQTMAEAVKTKT